MYLTYFNAEWSEGNTPLYGAMDHSLWLGSSVFDGARSIAGKTPDLELHLARVINSARNTPRPPASTHTRPACCARPRPRVSTTP